jgi:type IV secretory pathway VirD2 relaxase
VLTAPSTGGLAVPHTVHRRKSRRNRARSPFRHSGRQGARECNLATDPFEPLMTFRPRIAGKRSEADPHRAPLLSADIRRRLRRVPAPKRTGTRAPVRGVAGVTEPGVLSRRCLVKAHFVPMRAGGRDAARLHLAYLERDGVERDGSAGVLYGAGGDFDRVAFAEEIGGERRQFRFIISPEDAEELDLHAFTRALMASMSADLGRPLLWAAVNHHNTEHPHVHVVIRGIDADGRDVRIPPSYIKQDMRWRAQEIATRELGLRSERDIGRQRSAEIGQERPTSLDRKLGELAVNGSQIDARDLAQAPGRDRPLLLGRLQTLQRLALARPLARGGWSLAEGWQEQLRAFAERGDIIKRLHRVAGGDTSRYRLGGAADLGGAIEGVVRGKGLHDEQTGDLFAAVETAGGETHYVRLDPAAASLKTGDIVRVVSATEPWVKPTDRAVARVAAAAGGVYDPSRHLAQLEAVGGRSGNPSPADLVAGNVRRLERLERYGLAGRLTNGAWRIPKDLIEQLESRERTHPRVRVRVELAGPDLATQATYPGPTWIDRQAGQPDERAPWGFGAELALALEQRASFLRLRGLDRSGSSLVAELEATERTLLARQLARDLGAENVDRVAGLRGTLIACPALPSGRSYARVLDERTRRFVLVALSPELRPLEGRLVEVSIDEKGRLTIGSARHLNRGDRS